MALLKTIALLFCINQLTQAAVTYLGQRDCPSNDDYCYRSDVCAYVFTFPANDDETCPGRQDTVTAMSTVRDALNKQVSSIEKIANVSDGLVEDLSEAKAQLQRHDESLVKSQRYIANISDALDQFKDEGRAKSEVLEAELTRLKRENEEQQQILANQTRKLIEQREEINSIRDSITITMPDAAAVEDPVEARLSRLERNSAYNNNRLAALADDVAHRKQLITEQGELLRQQSQQLDQQEEKMRNLSAMSNIHDGLEDKKTKPLSRARALTLRTDIVK
ncbi:polyamine-modulated factor 1-binding protein 1-like [Ptychodera flava]|uniref:polyamine-modulated factor 1-binding protein 1-like n=1 Tax=Ptychodera flava TaxID=63121 RepID=UPI00396A0114